MRAPTDQPSRGRPGRGRLLLALSGLALGGLCLLPLISPVAARAGLYTVPICTAAAQPAEGLTYSQSSDVVALTTTPCPEFHRLPEFGISQEGLRHTPHRGSIGWTFHSPADTKVHALTLHREVITDGAGHSNLTWALVASGHTVPLDHFNDDGSPVPPIGFVRYEADAPFVTSTLSCIGGCGENFLFVVLTEISAELEDSVPPTVDRVEGSLVAQGPLRGSTSVTVAASDRGSGIREAALFVDGVEKDSVQDANGGSCVTPFVHLVPCKLNLEASLRLDTAKGLSDGPHEVRLVLTDAAGEATTKSFTVVVRNAPVNLSAPLLSGSATLGGRLMTSDGTWEGDLGRVLYQWLRCPAQLGGGESGGCTPISGATQSTYAPGPADVHGRLLVRVTAANDHGEGTVISAPSAIVPDAAGHTEPPPPPPTDTTAPRLSKPSLSRRRFRIGKVSGRRGSVLRLSSSEAAKLTLTVDRIGARRRARPLTVTRAIGAGPVRIPLTGRFGARRLAPGAYRLTLTARDAAGNVSPPARVGFTILPG
jgi:Ig domain of plant-specific actin-binding protein